MKPSTVKDILVRANVDQQTIAFAACVLHRLSWRFVRDWKSEMLSRRRATTTKPEVIVAAALYVACAWLDDRCRSYVKWLSQFAVIGLSLVCRILRSLTDARV